LKNICSVLVTYKQIQTDNTQNIIVKNTKTIKSEIL
jgi:hypothetical protein